MIKLNSLVCGLKRGWQALAFEVYFFAVRLDLARLPRLDWLDFRLDLEPIRAKTGKLEPRPSLVCTPRERESS